MKTRILLIEDDPGITITLQRLLASEEYEVVAEKRCPVHTIVGRIADEDVLVLKARRRHHLENHLAAQRTDDLIRIRAAEQGLARQVPLDDVRPLLDHPTHIGLGILRTVGIERAMPRDVRRVQSKCVDMDRIDEERQRAAITARDSRRRRRQ